jgi:hypothetical protein
MPLSPYGPNCKGGTSQYKVQNAENGHYRVTCTVLTWQRLGIYISRGSAISGNPGLPSIILSMLHHHHYRAQVCSWRYTWVGSCVPAGHVVCTACTATYHGDSIHHDRKHGAVLACAGRASYVCKMRQECNTQKCDAKGLRTYRSLSLVSHWVVCRIACRMLR